MSWWGFKPGCCSVCARLCPIYFKCLVKSLNTWDLWVWLFWNLNRFRCMNVFILPFFFPSAIYIRLNWDAIVGVLIFTFEVLYQICSSSAQWGLHELLQACVFPDHHFFRFILARVERREQTTITMPGWSMMCESSILTNPAICPGWTR